MRHKHLLILSVFFAFLLSCENTSLTDSAEAVQNPSGLKYMDLTNAREGKSILSSTPTVDTGGLVPTFELVQIKNEQGTILDETFLQHVSILGRTPVEINISLANARLDQNGNPITTVNGFNDRNNGAILVANGHNFPVGNYFFTIKVSTEKNGQTYETIFDDAFKLTILPLLPNLLIYSPKNQNLVVGDADGKTSAPIVPDSNPEIRFELVTHSDKLVIDENTGEIRLSSGYTFTEREELKPTVKVISKISGEEVVFENTITTIITDVPVDVPRESIYFFYPTLRTSGSFPQGGEGFSVQVDIPGNGEDIWGVVDNSAGRSLTTPDERPAGNTAQTVLETQTFNGSGATAPTSSWMVTTTQNLTPFRFGFNLSFNYYYQPAYQIYMADGRTPTDMEVYISTDYTGGDIQDTDGNWLNGTWTQVNNVMKCNRSEGTAGSVSTGAPWGPEFIGTPYPGNQAGPDPDGRKMPGTTFYNKWVRCTYDIPVSQIVENFTVAFKVTTYFEGTLLNNSTAPGRGGTYFLSDFHFKAAE